VQFASRTLPLDQHEPVVLCPIAPAECAHRTACELDELRLSRARAGNRADFDALFDHAFARVYRAARRRLPSGEQAEAATRACLLGALGSPDPSGGCVTARLLRRIQQIGSSGRGV
jgi:hypothetical protein